MLKLQGNFGSFLWQAAIFESVRELIPFSNPHQELRLGAEFSDLHSCFGNCCSERGEVHMGSHVLLAWRFVRIGARRVLTISHQRSSMSARKLFVARVAIVNDDQKSSANRACDFCDPLLCGDRDFDALTRLGMDSITIKKFQFFGHSGKPDFGQTLAFGSIVVDCEMEFAARANDFDWQRVEELIREDDQRSFVRQSARNTWPFIS